MGLRLWTEPTDKETAAEAVDKTTAHARSSIRRNSRTSRARAGFTSEASARLSTAQLANDNFDSPARRLGIASGRRDEAERVRRDEVARYRTERLARDGNTGPESRLTPIARATPEDRARLLYAQMSADYDSPTEPAGHAGSPPLPPPPPGHPVSVIEARNWNRPTPVSGGTVVAVEHRQGDVERMVRARREQDDRSLLDSLLSRQLREQSPWMSARPYVPTDTLPRTVLSSQVDSEVRRMREASGGAEVEVIVLASGHNLIRLAPQVSASERETTESLNGLGDRNRSASPANSDSQWATLFSTLTPDPQVPSASSSFVSGVGASASSSNNAGTAGTSMTTAGTADDPAATNCDENESHQGSDTEADGHEGEADTLGPFERGLRAFDLSVDIQRISSGANEDDLGGMQRIVRGLARREDIPDEWWAQVGLSRILPRGESSG